jgi:hypothetical protein
VSPGQRSDSSIVRQSDVQVDISRVTPDMTHVVSGSSTVVGAPNLTFGTANTVGSTTTAVSVNSSIALFGTGLPAGLSASAIAGTSAFAARADHIHAGFGLALPSALAAAAATGSSNFASRGDHVHLFPPTLRSTANASTLTLTDDATGQSLTASLGRLLVSNELGFNFEATGAATNILSFDADISLGHITGIDCGILGGNASSLVIRGFDNTYSAIGGTFTSSTFVGYRTTTFSFNPSTGSNTSNNAYGVWLTSPQIRSTGGGWTNVAGALIEGPSRFVVAPTVNVAAGIITEPAAVGGTTQIGVYVRQRTAGQVGAVRAGIWIDAQNSGTSRYSIFGTSDLAYFTGPVQVGGAFRHLGAQVGLYGLSSVVQSTGWSFAGYSTSKTLNGTSFTLNQLRDFTLTLAQRIMDIGGISN